MAKSQTTIELIVSTNKSLSSMSLASREAALVILKQKYDNVCISVVNDKADFEQVILRRPQLAFLGMKYIPNSSLLGITDPNKLWISSRLSKEGISFTGSGGSASRLEHNKQFAKQIMIDNDIATAHFQVIRRGSSFSERDISTTYPAFIKPLDRGGGAGIDTASLVHNYSQLRTKVLSLATDIRADSLIEAYLPGREFSVGILRTLGSQEYSAMPIEIIAPKNSSGDRFLSSSIKSNDQESSKVIDDPALKSQLSNFALKAFHALGAKDYGRIDVRLDAYGKPHFLEANLLPSLLDNYGNFPRACQLNADIQHKDLLLLIVDLALDSKNNHFEAAVSESDDLVSFQATAIHSQEVLPQATVRL